LLAVERTLSSSVLDSLVAGDDKRKEVVTMLVLSRRATESVVIRGNIIVTVVDVRGKRVRLGIEAPKEVTVHRKEVCEKISKATSPST
jgi:carbon storage regulator